MSFLKNNRLIILGQSFILPDKIILTDLRNVAALTNSAITILVNPGDWKSSWGESPQTIVWKHEGKIHMNL